MKLVTYLSAGGPRVAAVRDDGYVDLHGADHRIPVSMRALLAEGEPMLKRAQAALAQSEAIPHSSLKLLAPVPDPEKIICIGLNYADHAAESGQEIPKQPVVFSKFVTTVCAPEAPIVLPKVSEKVDYEAELVAVIGRGGKHIPQEKALSHVAGYTCGHDVSARDWQMGAPGGQWLLGKSFDTFAPFGPWIVTADEVGDPGALDIRLRLNGQTMQNSNTRQLIFSIAQLVSHVSKVFTLAPGDVIFTGTPPGVGGARKPPVWLRPGDMVEVEIERIGVLRNPVAAENTP